ncbi:hypothetical protein D1872_37100 [compost metagenome]
MEVFRITTHRMLNVTNIEKGRGQMTSYGKFEFYAGLVMNTLMNLRPDTGSEFRNAIIKYEVIPITSKYFETRFSNTLKQFNNVPERAFDLYMTKKNMEFFNQFVEETYLLVAEHIHRRQIVPLQLIIAKEDTMEQYFRTVRNELRRIIHVLYDEINKNAENIDAKIKKREDN